MLDADETHIETVDGWVSGHMPSVVVCLFCFIFMINQGGYTISLWHAFSLAFKTIRYQRVFYGMFYG